MAGRRAPELADAALRLVSRDGLGALTFRALAAEAGISLGAVQKAFASKEELLDAVVARARDQVVLDQAREPGRPTLRAWLLELVIATLPLDDARRSATIVGVALADRAPFDPELAGSLAAGDRELRGRIALLAGRAIAEGEVARTVVPDLVAGAVLALMAGLAGQLLYDPRPELEVRAVVDAALAGMLPAA
ncbi:TetR/AcrR family transcriptional regulator [Agromyces sp. MMS24-JH15]|uniref:TetR/AcrR family transcriptional regulator n=1 Tax=Agromyces sp. MMS24-JH15 TaxID=3243765 RepID=UPI00374A6D08